MSGNPLVTQGTLNRVRCHIVVANNPALNITSSYMGRRLATIRFEDAFADQIGTGTGVVNSPVPYVMAAIEASLLRTTSLADAWLAQSQNQSRIGPITIHSDTAAFSAIQIDNVVIRDLQPGVYDGTDPVSMLTLRGIYYVNNALWSF